MASTRYHDGLKVTHHMLQRIDLIPDGIILTDEC